MSIPAAEKRIRDFEEMAFGMFVHWGLYSQLGQGEWIKNFKSIKDEDYDKLIDSFNPKNFDAEKLVLLAKNSGMRYLTFTARHHDGFSLYDTGDLTSYNSINSPAHRDFVREIIESCRKHDIVPILYHTTLDWHNKDFEEDFDAYLEYLKNSIEILCKNYGRIGGFWFDGNWSKPDADWKLDELYGTIRKYQPQAMIINNTGLNARGEIIHPEIDAVTYEQGLAEKIDHDGKEKYVAGETCYTVNGHWGYGANDFNYKSPAELIKILCDCRKNGANLLLNVGPDGDGNIPPMIEASLSLLGKWIKTQKEIIYKCRPCEVLGTGSDFALKAPNGDLFLFIYDLPIDGDENVTVRDGGLKPRHFMGINKKVKRIRWLDSGKDVYFNQQIFAQNLVIQPSGYPYGTDLVVRVAHAELEE